MKAILIFLMIFNFKICFAGGNSGFMMLPQIPNGTVLAWTPIQFQFDGYGATTTQTFVLTNLGALKSKPISLSLSPGDPTYSLINDNCTGVKLLPSNSCTVDVQFTMPNNIVPVQSLDATDGVTSAPTASIKNCNAC